jgi:hypothetical protein
MIPNGDPGSNSDSDPSEVEQTGVSCLLWYKSRGETAWLDTLYNCEYHVAVNDTIYFT